MLHFAEKALNEGKETGETIGEKKGKGGKKGKGKGGREEIFCEIQKEMINGKTKVVVAYFGELVNRYGY